MRNGHCGVLGLVILAGLLFGGWFAPPSRKRQSAKPVVPISYRIAQAFNRVAERLSHACSANRR